MQKPTVFTLIGLITACIGLVACEKPAQTEKESSPKTETSQNQETPAIAEKPQAPIFLAIDSVLEQQDADSKARYVWRHPKETLELFDIQPGQVVVEVLPGGGWYTKILLPVLGQEGRLIGVDYSLDIWPNFTFADEAFLAKRATWSEDWISDVDAWNVRPSASVQAHTFANLPEDLTGTVDRVLFIRALHNLSRYEDKGGFLSQAITETGRVLKPGGLVGVVQHQAPEAMSDEWADGSRGYLKKSFVIELFESAGFEFVSESDLNENPADQPGEDDIVWRLPPTYYTSKDDEKLKASFTEIGESNRMTLVFKKPEQAPAEE